MAQAKDFIQHGEGIFGLGENAGTEFGAVISNVSYNWSANGNAELIGDQGVMLGQALYDSRCEITFECYRKKDGTKLPHIGQEIEIATEIIDLSIQDMNSDEGDNLDEEGTPYTGNEHKITKAIVQSVEVTMEVEGYQSFTVTALYSPGIADLHA